MNERIKQLSDGNERITLVDLDLGPVVMGRDAVDASDKLHLTAEGYDTLARAVFSSLQGMH